MANHSPTTTRRTALTLLATPALALVPPLLTSSCVREARAGTIADRTAWNAAAHRYRAAWKRLNDHPIHSMMPDHPDYARLNTDEADCIRESMEAEAAVMLCPAPDHAAVVEKLEIYLHAYGEDSEGLVTASLDDLRRLAGEVL